MTPVINPWVFYFMSVVEVLKIFGTVAAVFAVSFAVGFWIAAIVNKCDYGSDDEDYLKYKSIAKPLTWIATLTLILAIFVPGEKTITKMLIAQNVTYERVDAVTDTVETVYNDIIGLFEDDSNE